MALLKHVVRYRHVETDKDVWHQRWLMERREDADVCCSPEWTGMTRLVFLRRWRPRAVQWFSQEALLFFRKNVVHWLVILRHQCVDGCSDIDRRIGWWVCHRRVLVRQTCGWQQCTG